MSDTTSIGERIRYLRHERKLTQEELAEQLNVTSQAVSKWENGSGMPDISQIVPLAHVFGVSTDVLFGTVDENNDEVERIIKKVEEIGAQLSHNDEEENDSLYKQWGILEDALKIYPTSTKLLIKSIGTGLFYSLRIGWCKDDEVLVERSRAIINECIREAKLLRNYSDNIDDVTYATYELINGTGQFELAVSEAERLPCSAVGLRGTQMAWIMEKKGDRDGELAQRQKNVLHLLESVYCELLPMSTAYSSQGRHEGAYTALRASYDIYKAVFADEIVPYFGLCNLYENIAYECMELGRHDEALDWLEILYKVMKEHNDRCGTVTHPKTMILSGETIEWGGGGRGAARVCMQYTLEFQWFDPIRDTDRFRELVRLAGELDE